MILAGLGLSYIGVLLCYLASPKSEAGVPGRAWIRSAPGSARAAGAVATALALAAFTVALPAVQAILVAITVLMAFTSIVAIAAPLAPGWVSGAALPGLAAIAVGLSRRMF